LKKFICYVKISGQNNWSIGPVVSPDLPRIPNRYINEKEYVLFSQLSAYDILIYQKVKNVYVDIKKQWFHAANAGAIDVAVSLQKTAYIYNCNLQSQFKTQCKTNH
jgi:hypothetical protein